MGRVPLSEVKHMDEGKSTYKANIERVIDDLENKCVTELDIAKSYDLMGNLVLFVKHANLAEGYKYAAEELKKIL